MTPNDKFQAFQRLVGNGVCVSQLPDGTWAASAPDLEVRRGYDLVRIGCMASTREDAIDALWAAYTELTPDEYVVFGGYSSGRMAVKWTPLDNVGGGYSGHWKSVPEVRPDPKAERWRRQEAAKRKKPVVLAARALGHRRIEWD